MGVCVYRCVLVPLDVCTSMRVLLHTCRCVCVCVCASLEMHVCVCVCVPVAAGWCVSAPPPSSPARTPTPSSSAGSAWPQLGCAPGTSAAARRGRAPWSSADDPRRRPRSAAVHAGADMTGGNASAATTGRAGKTHINKPITTI